MVQIDSGWMGSRLTSPGLSGYIYRLSAAGATCTDPRWRTVRRLHARRPDS